MKPPFKTKNDLKEFIALNIPFAVKPTRPAKTVLVGTFTSDNALKEAVEVLAERLWVKINRP